MIIQLNPPLPLETPKGKGIAHFLIDYGIENNLIFVCFQNETRECWCWESKDIKIEQNITLNRLKE